jgi:hypothetical protein
LYLFESVRFEGVEVDAEGRLAGGTFREVLEITHPVIVTGWQNEVTGPRFGVTGWQNEVTGPRLGGPGPRFGVTGWQNEVTGPRFGGPGPTALACQCRAPGVSGRRGFRSLWTV